MSIKQQVVWAGGSLVLYLLILIPNITGVASHRYEQTDILQFKSTARQHIERGLTETFGRDYRIDGETRYLNNPGLLSVVLSVLVRVMGDSNATARIMSITLNLVMLALLMYLWSKTDLPLWLAVVVFFSMPVVILYGRDLSYHNLITPLLLATLIIYTRERSHYKKLWFYGLMYGLTLITASSGWAGFLVYPLLISWEWQEQRDKQLAAVLMLSFASAFGLIIWQNYMITGSAIAPLRATMEQADYYKMRIINVYGESFGPAAWLRQQLVFLTKNFTGPVILTALGGVLISSYRIYQRLAMMVAERIAWGTIALSAAFIAGTGPYSYVHGYLQWLFIPPFMLFTMIFWQKVPARYMRLFILLFITFSWPVTAVLMGSYYNFW